MVFRRRLAVPLVLVAQVPQFPGGTHEAELHIPLLKQSTQVPLSGSQSGSGDTQAWVDKQVMSQSAVTGSQRSPEGQSELRQPTHIPELRLQKGCSGSFSWHPALAGTARIGSARRRPGGAVVAHLGEATSRG